MQQTNFKRCWIKSSKEEIKKQEENVLLPADYGNLEVGKAYSKGRKNYG